MLSLVGDSTELTVAVERLSGGVCVVRLRGELGRGGAHALNTVLLDQFDRRARLLIFDLSRLSSIRPDGMSLLVRLACTAGELDLGFCLVGADQAEMSRRIEVTGWLALFRLHDTVGEAVRGLG